MQKANQKAMEVAMKQFNAKLASTNTVTQTTDSISHIEQIMANAIVSARTFDPAVGIPVYTAVADKWSLFTGSTSNMLQPYADKPVATGDTDLADQEFTIITQSIFHEIAYRIFKNTVWKEAIANIATQGLPPEFEAFIVSYTSGSIAAEVETTLWNANSGLAGAPTAAQPGFWKIIFDLLTAATLTGQIVDFAADVTAIATVQASLQELVDAAPLALIADKQNVKIFCSPQVETSYRRSLQLQAYAVLSSEPTNFSGYELVVIPNMRPDAVVMGYAGNLGLGMPSNTELVDLLVVDMFTQGLGNFAMIVGNIGYGAGAATTDWVIGANTAPA